MNPLQSVYWERSEVLVISLGDDIPDDSLFPEFSCSLVDIIHGMVVVESPKDFKNEINCIAKIPAHYGHPDRNWRGTFSQSLHFTRASNIPVLY
jgi:hypothetical protein